MGEIFEQVYQNKIFMATIMAWIIAQTIKVLLGIIREKKFDFRWFVGTGGMPSSHSAGVSCLAIGVGIKYGFDGALFAIAASFAAVVMFDANVVRRSTGRQAHILNRIMEDIYWKGKIHENSLRELIGHTPIEVITGCLLGIALAFFLISP